MNKISNVPETRSLLPYLEGRKSPCLAVSLVGGDPDGFMRNPFPFVTLDDRDPLATLLQARFLSDTEASVKELFLLVEKQSYSLKGETLRPVTNGMVEKAWQSAFSFYRSADPSTGFLPLAAQVSDDGSLMRLASLFYCKKRAIFFHPPCPRCGLPLDLCTDDSYLLDRGLPPYSGSLTRYLFCRSRECEGGSAFYAFERAPRDPSHVKDYGDLVRSFASSLDSGLLGRLPCAQCSEREDCLGSDQAATLGMVPFSFYPFYMLAFESMSLNAVDFSWLLSGAPVREVADRLRIGQQNARAERVERFSSGRTRGFLFQNDPRFFLEVLYLKLSLLHAIMEKAPDEDRLAHPDLGLSLDAMWVKVAENSLLPSFWSFTVRPLDLFYPRSLGTSKLSPIRSPNLYSLALIWFYVLTVNKSQSLEDVALAIEDHIKATLPEGRSQQSVRSGRPSDDAFLPAHLFWSPGADEAPILPETYVSLWERSLALGWSLLGSAQNSTLWSRDGFLNEIEALRGQVHAEMFSAALSDSHKMETSPLSNSDIHCILEAIMSKSRAEYKRGPRPAAGLADVEEESMQTVILTSGSTGSGTRFDEASGRKALDQAAIPSPGSAHPKQAAQPPGEEKENEGLEKRVILSPWTDASAPAGRDAMEAGGEAATSRHPEDELEKTVIISRKGQEKEGPQGAARKEPEEADEEKTVVLFRNGSAAQPGEPAAAPQTGKKKAKSEDLEGTLILPLPDKDRRQ